MKLELIQGDCMDVMRDIEDNYFDLAVVDPPYGIGAGKGTEIYLSNNGKQNWGEIKKNKETIYGDWDNAIPEEDYFMEIKRVSKNRIIWGGNYFLKYLSGETGCIVWDKENGNSFFADGELAIHSFNNKLRIFRHLSCGFMGSHKNRETRIHPTQKPVALYDWIYHNYAQPGQKILDTHLGSGSNAIAAHYAKMGEFTGIELDPDYFTAAQDRIKECTRQQELF